MISRGTSISPHVTISVGSKGISSGPSISDDGSGGGPPAATFRILTESGSNLDTETLSPLRQERSS